MSLKGLVITILIFFSGIGYLILKGDPVRDGDVGQASAVSQVKAFAAFIEKRPDLLYKKTNEIEESSGPRPAAPSAAIRNDANFTEDQKKKVEEGFGQFLGSVDRQETREQLRAFIREQPDQVYSYLVEKISEDQARSQTWTESVKGLMLLTEFQHSSALDSLGEQLVAARSDPNESVRELSQRMYEHYVAHENRSTRMNQVIQAFNKQSEKVSNGVTDRVPASELPPVENESVNGQ
jgi:hypothetical protein